MKSKIQELLKEAERQADKTPQESSVTCVSRAFPLETEAESFFEQLKGKILHIKDWNAESGLTGYELFDENGAASHRRQAILGDFVRLTLHGSGKSDWVKIIDIDDAPDEIVLTVKPFFDPTAEEPDEKITSHFFTSEATNNFCLERKGKTINFRVIGLSEKTNTAETEGIVETIRNVATANVGSYFGIQKAEWKIFCENFLETKESGKG